MDELEEFEEPQEPQLKKRKLVKVAEATTPVNTVQGQLASLLKAGRKTSPKPVMKIVAEVKPLNMAPLDLAGVTLGTTIPVESVSFQPLGIYIKHILDDIELEVDSEISIGTEREKVRRLAATAKEGVEPWALSLMAEEEHMAQDPTPIGARVLTFFRS